MMYEFEKDGEYTTRDYPMGRAPKIGNRTKDGWTRIVSRPRLQRAEMSRHTRTKIVAPGLWRKGTKKALENPAPHYNEKGFACFDSQREIREYCARSEGTVEYRGSDVYDD